MSEGIPFLVLAGIWAALSLGGGLFWWLASPATRRSWHPRLTVAAGILFFAVAYSLAPNSMLFVGFSALAAAIVTFVNLRYVKICLSCGAYRKFAAMDPDAEAPRCRRCGANLE